MCDFGPYWYTYGSSLEDTNVTKVNFNDIPSYNETIQNIQSLDVA